MGTGGDVIKATANNASNPYSDQRGGAAVVVVSSSHMAAGNAVVPPALLVPTVNGRPVQIVNMPASCAAAARTAAVGDGSHGNSNSSNHALVMEEVAAAAAGRNHHVGVGVAQPRPNPLHLLIPDSHPTAVAAGCPQLLKTRTNVLEHAQSMHGSDEHSKNQYNQHANGNSTPGEGKREDSQRSASSSTSNKTKTSATLQVSSPGARTVSSGGDEEEDKQQDQHHSVPQDYPPHTASGSQNDGLATLPSIKATQKDRTCRSAQFTLSQHKVKLLMEILRLVEMYGAHRTSPFWNEAAVDGTTLTVKQETDAEACPDVEDMHDEDHRANNPSSSGQNNNQSNNIHCPMQNLNRALKSSWIMVQESLRRQPRGSKYKRMDRPYCFRRKVMVAVQSWVDWAQFRGYPSPDTIWNIMEKKRKKRGTGGAAASGSTKSSSDCGDGQEILEEAVRGLPDFVQLIYKIHNESRYCVITDGNGSGGNFKIPSVMEDVSGDEEEEDKEDGTTTSTGGASSSVDGSTGGGGGCGAYHYLAAAAASAAASAAAARDSSASEKATGTRLEDAVDTKNEDIHSDLTQGSRKSGGGRRIIGTEELAMSHPRSDNVQVKPEEPNIPSGGRPRRLSAAAFAATAQVPCAGQKRPREEGSGMMHQMYQAERMGPEVIYASHPYLSGPQPLPPQTPLSPWDLIRTMSEWARNEGTDSVATGATGATAPANGESKSSLQRNPQHAALVQSYLESVVEYQKAQTSLLQKRIEAMQYQEDDADLRRLEALQESIDTWGKKEAEEATGESKGAEKQNGQKQHVAKEEEELPFSSKSKVLAAYVKMRDRCLERLCR